MFVAGCLLLICCGCLEFDFGVCRLVVDSLGDLFVGLLCFTVVRFTLVLIGC